MLVRATHAGTLHYAVQYRTAPGVDFGLGSLVALIRCFALGHRMTFATTQQVRLFNPRSELLGRLSVSYTTWQGSQSGWKGRSVAMILQSKPLTMCTI